MRSSQNNDDSLDDTIVSAAVKVKGEKAIDSLTTWDYGGSLTYNSFDTYDDLNNYEFEVNTRYRFGLTSGLTAPVYSRDDDVSCDFDFSLLLSILRENNKTVTVKKPCLTGNVRAWAGAG